MHIVSCAWLGLSLVHCGHFLCNAGASVFFGWVKALRGSSGSRHLRIARQHNDPLTMLCTILWRRFASEERAFPRWTVSV